MSTLASRIDAMATGVITSIDTDLTETTVSEWFHAHTIQSYLQSYYAGDFLVPGVEWPEDAPKPVGQEMELLEIVINAYLDGYQTQEI